ncbi:MAG: FAD-binding protein [Candidatus Limnocylindrales bacterium]
MGSVLPHLARQDADVIVVGAGAAGGAAFLEAAAAGASVIGVDLLASFGGTAATSGGGCCLPGTPVQAARGIVDGPELALRDLIAAGDGEADEAWARSYLDHAVTDVHDWLVGLGVTFVDLRAQEHESVPRWHLPRGNGRGLMDVLWSAIEAHGLADRWHWSTRLDDLIVEGGHVVGIRVVDPTGRPSELRAPAIVMATGGFAGDLDRVLEHVPWLRSVERVLVGGGVGALGLGHRILADRGAALTHLDDIWTYAYATPDYRDPAGRRGLVVRGIDDAIWVNRQGRRFHDESLSGPGTATPALLAQEPPTSWAILDRPAALRMRIADPYFRVEAGSPPDRIEELLSVSPYIHAGDTPASLAGAAGIDPEALTTTVDQWDALLASGVAVDHETGRSLTGVRPLSERPLYAMQFFPLVRKNLGGVRTDLHCRVLDASDAPIPGLYAAGELAGFGGGHLSGRRALEGIMIGASLFGGRVAGAQAAAATGHASPAGTGPSAVRS